MRDYNAGNLSRVKGPSSEGVRNGGGYRDASASNKMQMIFGPLTSILM